MVIRIMMVVRSWWSWRSLLVSEGHSGLMVTKVVVVEEVSRGHEGFWWLCRFLQGRGGVRSLLDQNAQETMQ